MLATASNEFKDCHHLLNVVRHMGILPPQQRATPTDFVPIPSRKNILGSLGAYAVYVALEPYYDDLVVTHVNGIGVDLIGFKDGVKEYIEVKNWRQRYTTGPSLTPNKYKAEVRTRFPYHTKQKKILVTSATWSSDTGTMMREDNTLPYSYIHQITNPQTFKEAVAEIRYQHELRLWRDQEERRLFNISRSPQQQIVEVDVVGGCCYEFDDVVESHHSLNERNNLHYSAKTSLDFSPDSQPLPKRQKSEMEDVPR